MLPSRSFVMIRSRVTTNVKKNEARKKKLGEALRLENVPARQARVPGDARARAPPQNAPAVTFARARARLTSRGPAPSPCPSAGTA